MNTKCNSLLGLSGHEEKVLISLPTEDGLNVSDIARTSKTPRMSVYLALHSLKKRGLADYDRKGKRRLWKKLSNQAFSELMINTAKSIYDNKERVEIKHGENNGFVILKGLNNLFTIFERIAAGHKGERLIGIQPTSSMTHVVKKLSWKTIKPIQDAIRDNKIIVQGLVREDYYPTFVSLLKSKEEKKEAIKSFIGRLTDMVLVSNQYLNSETELMMFKDVAFLVNWKDEVAIEIKNKEMLNFMLEFFELARGYGKKINQNEYLRELETRIS
jgi:predicted transcriptional regulator